MGADHAMSGAEGSAFRMECMEGAEHERRRDAVRGYVVLKFEWCRRASEGEGTPFHGAIRAP